MAGIFVGAGKFIDAAILNFRFVLSYPCLYILLNVC
jgi:hypothetical protein